MDAPGYDLTGLLTGSEGTMALVTGITVRLMRQPELVKTLLAVYDTVDDCADSVAEITARAITPAAVEMLDGVMLRMVEEATHAGYPMDAAAVLLIELEGLKEAVEEQVKQIEEACKSCRAREVRIARSATERELLWKGRKNAFGAVGRVSPAYYVQDGVVPRTKIAPTLREIHRVAEKYGLTISNIFHAGDGNMHPIILFNHHKAGELERAKAAGDEILAILHPARWVHYRRARRGDGKDGVDRRAIFRRDARFDRAVQEAVRSGVPVEPGKNAAHRQGLHGNPAAGGNADLIRCDRERGGVAGLIARRNNYRRCRARRYARRNGAVDLIQSDVIWRSPCKSHGASDAADGHGWLLNGDIESVAGCSETEACSI